MCVYIYICIYVYICVYTYICIYTYILLLASPCDLCINDTCIIVCVCVCVCVSVAAVGHGPSGIQPPLPNEKPLVAATMTPSFSWTAVSSILRAPRSCSWTPLREMDTVHVLTYVCARACVSKSVQQAQLLMTPRREMDTVDVHVWVCPCVRV